MQHCEDGFEGVYGAYTENPVGNRATLSPCVILDFLYTQNS